MVDQDTLFILKKADLFSWPVQLRIKRSKQGGASDPKIGSWTGLFLSFIFIMMMMYLGFMKYQDMVSFEKIKYGSLSVRNSLDDSQNNIGPNKANFTSAVIVSEYDFLPSLQFKVSDYSD